MAKEICISKIKTEFSKFAEDVLARRGVSLQLCQLQGARWGYMCGIKNPGVASDFERVKINPQFGLTIYGSKKLSEIEKRKIVDFIEGMVLCV